MNGVNFESVLLLSGSRSSELGRQQLISGLAFLNDLGFHSFHGIPQFLTWRVGLQQLSAANNVNRNKGKEFNFKPCCSIKKISLHLKGIIPDFLCLLLHRFHFTP